MPLNRSGTTPSITAVSSTWSYSEKSLLGMWSIPAAFMTAQCRRRSSRAVAWRSAAVICFDQ
ncbi:MAG TPA: hypothetical protein VHW23_41080 [Kofleriaceae bacterium]|jgi:hypothetical protein|nr:hypothetical protein [Kofleriaceae bacterium]